VSAPQAPSVAVPSSAPETVRLAPLPEPPASSEPPTVSVMDLPSVPLRPAIVPVAVPAAGGSVAVAAKVDADGIVVVAPAPAASKAVAHAGTPTIRTDLANCSPPFYFDELGLKIFKPECVN
jgi:hypothetical protein